MEKKLEFTNSALNQIKRITLKEEKNILEFLSKVVGALDLSIILVSMTLLTKMMYYLIKQLLIKPH